MKIESKPAWIFLALTTVLAAQSCSYFRRSEFATLVATDLTSIIDNGASEPDKRRLAQNENERKKLIQTLKQKYALAQAAEAEGLNKGERFQRELALGIDQLLATEYSKRNRDLQVSKEELDAYFAAHKDAFESDFKVITANQKPEPSNEEKESFKPRWSEIKLRAEKGRQAGLEKEPGFGISVKINKAYLLAGLYTDLLQERFKPTAEEKAKYLTEHPEADMEKLRQKAQGMLDRVKGGESFEKVADEVKQDGTKGRFEDLPWFGPGMMDPGFEKAAFALEKGQTSTELVKSRFGFHIIRVDDKRKAVAPPPPAPILDPAAPKPEPRDEVRARHILVDTREAENFEKRLSDEKVKRALEDAEIKYVVKVPDDFKVNVAGFDPNRVPGPGGGLNGPMQGPDAKKN